MKINTKPVRRFNFNIEYLRYFLLSLLLILIFVLQMTPGCFPSIGMIRAQLIIPFVVSVAVIKGETAGAFFGLASGILWDSVSPEMWGYHTFMLILVGCFTGLSVMYFFRRNIGAAAFTTVVILLAYSCLYWFFFVAMRGFEGAWKILLYNYFPSAAYTLIFFFPIYFAVRLISGKECMSGSI